MSNEKNIKLPKSIKKITANDLRTLLENLRLIYKNPNENAQIICHGLGKRGIESINDILNNSGLEIVRNHPESNNYVNSGLLSTNACYNDPITNTVDIDSAFSHKWIYSDENGKFHTIISAIPQTIRDITLGKIIKHSKDKSCVLDDLGINNLPKEFILGVIVSDRSSQEANFILNPNFLMLKQENYENAYNSVLEIFKNSPFKSPEEYYNDLNKRIEFIAKRKEMGFSIDALKPTEYQIEASRINRINTTNIKNNHNQR